MKFATRLNSYLPVYDNNFDVIYHELHSIGINYVDLNYPEHFKDTTVEQMKEYLHKNNLKVNGLALRFRDEFVNGEYSNTDYTISEKAIELTKQAIDVCKELNGDVITIWEGFDGFDYSFQVSYMEAWTQIKKTLLEIAEYAGDMKISLEYKPFEPRSYTFLDGMGNTMLMMRELNRENVGLTLDYCHMLMKHENPAFAADLLGAEGKLFGVHLNDGYGLMDDGLMVGTASPFKTLEFLFYLRKHNYDSAIYFDTFPVIEDPLEETKQNIEMIKLLNNKIDEIGMDYIQEIIQMNNATKSAELMREFIQ